MVTPAARRPRPATTGATRRTPPTSRSAASTGARPRRSSDSHGTPPGVAGARRKMTSPDSRIGHRDAEPPGHGRSQRRVHQIADAVDGNGEPPQAASPLLEGRCRSLVDRQQHEKPELRARLLDQPDRRRRRGEPGSRARSSAARRFSSDRRSNPSAGSFRREVLHEEDGEVFRALAGRNERAVACCSTI